MTDIKTIAESALAACKAASLPWELSIFVTEENAYTIHAHAPTTPVERTTYHVFAVGGENNSVCEAGTALTPAGAIAQMIERLDAQSQRHEFDEWLKAGKPKAHAAVASQVAS